MQATTLLIGLVSLFQVSAALDDSSQERRGKFFPVLQVVRFQNDVCVASTGRNGTCYTVKECKANGGTGSGTCAKGYGICCVFSLSCGETTAERCAYLIQESTSVATTPDPCMYTICRCAPNICRIRFDFVDFSINPPTTGTAVAAGALETNGGAIGDCATDTFSITSPGNLGSPVICGMNMGQHMIVDASDDCNVATFDLNGAGTRAWNIKVTQYPCGDNPGGPDGCLQYHTANTGTISSFNFEGLASTPTSTHLSNQCYAICFRQNANKCAICFTPVNPGGGVVTDETFGLSVTSIGAIAQSDVDNTACNTDYLQIPGGVDDSLGVGNAFIVGGDNGPSITRVCGRFFSAAIGATSNDQSICTETTPFVIRFKTDDNEVTGGGGVPDFSNNEQFGLPGGIVGFSLMYELIDC